jgi:cellulose synthase/poly-beta-1,6-N-acetylglucosamine synthase-like glycosyltransferase
MLGYLGTVLIVFSVTHLMLVVLLACWPRTGLPGTMLVAGCAACGGCVLAWRLVPGHAEAGLLAAGAVPVMAGGYARMSRWLHPVGAAMWLSWLLLGAALLSWGTVFLAGLHVSGVTSGLLWVTSGLSAVTLPSAVVTTREGWDPLLRRRARRPARPAPVRAGGWTPRISVHVPCHAEPPQIVIGTLERLAQLDYPDFEVLVIDNNTADPALWWPVAACCDRLGDRFRFLHVEGLRGAKAGALNWALPHTCPRAELIAVVDADYHARPSWLRDVAGYFADPTVGFVQCPHAYRGYAGSALGQWANWEYAVFFVTGMVSLDQAGAGLTVGTMSLIRRAALQRAGGWAEWCLTEDSELAIRIHAAGYRSVYLTEPYGRGLIPETFDGYRRQRYRWTYGPVQEFFHHWPLFLPRPFGTRSALTGQQKIHHANHGLDVIGIGLRALCFPLAAAAALSMLAHHEHIPMPGELWLAATCLLGGTVLMRWLTYQRIVRATPRQALGGILAFAALTHIITIASLRALIRRPAHWQRTDKFRQRQRGLRALGHAGAETILGLAGLAAGIGLAVFCRGGIASALAIGLAVQALSYLAAPIVAVAADRSLSRAPHHSPRPAPLPAPRPTAHVPHHPPRPAPPPTPRATAHAPHHPVGLALPQAVYHPHAAASWGHHRPHPVTADTDYTGG